MRIPPTPVRVIAAPMAGGPSTAQLVAAVSNAGGLGFLAAGYLPTQEVSGQVAATKRLTSRPFGVNLFVPAPIHSGSADQARLESDVAAFREHLREAADRLDVPLPEVNWRDTDNWAGKVELLTQVSPVPVVSFTFGCPEPTVVEAFHRAGTAVLVTVTGRAEAEAGVACGADGLVVQGFEAGGHRGTHDVATVPNELDHLALLPLLTDLGIPLIAAGGITTAGDTHRALAAGASAVQVGTAFLRTHEAGTSAAHRMGLTDPALTSVITRAFSGRPARGLRNRFVMEHDAQVPAAYPAVDQLTKPLRAAAARRGDLGGVSIWAGSGWRAATEEPAAHVVRRLAGLPEER